MLWVMVSATASCHRRFACPLCQVCSCTTCAAMICKIKPRFRRWFVNGLIHRVYEDEVFVWGSSSQLQMVCYVYLLRAICGIASRWRLLASMLPWLPA